MPEDNIGDVQEREDRNEDHGQSAAAVCAADVSVVQ